MERPLRKDLTYQELEKLLVNMDYNKIEGGGSRVKFYRNDGSFPISIHKPHPGNILKTYVVREIQKILEKLAYGILNTKVMWEASIILMRTRCSGESWKSRG